MKLLIVPDAETKLVFDLAALLFKEKIVVLRLHLVCCSLFDTEE